MNLRVAITNFTGGEVSPTLSARYDLARYKASLQRMENFVPNLHGAAERRPGTVFLADLGGPAMLLPFSFSAEAEHNFVLVFQEKKLRIARAGGMLPVTDIAAPYAFADLHDVTYAQVGDVVYLAHKKYPLHKVTRSGSGPDYTWAIKPVALNTSLAAPAAPTVTFSGSGGNFPLRYKVVAVDANGKESLGSAAGSASKGKHPSDWIQGEYTTVSWSSVSGAVEYNVYREEAGYFGFIGISETTSFTDNNFQADIADTPREDWDPFSGNNHPGVVAFHQQRMVLANTPKAPQAFYMSRVGDFENFRKSRPLQEDDPVEYLIASGSIDAITWAASFGDLLLGTAGSEYKASGDGAITAKNISITAQSYWGSYGLPPIIIGNSIMHVQRHGARVRDLFYSLEKDGYAGNDLSIMAPHLFDGHTLKQWTYQQTPGSHIWIVRDDGVLLALTYLKEHDIWGWSRHLTDGEVQSVASVSGDNEDTVALVVRRQVNGVDKYYLERLAARWAVPQGVKESYYVDCGITYRGDPTTTITGLGHLEGKELAVLADGSPVDGCTVSGGAITLPAPASIVHAGLPFTSVLSPTSVEFDTQEGSTLGKQRAIGICSMRVNSTVGGRQGTSLDTLYEIPVLPQAWGEPVDLFSGDLTFTPEGGVGPTASLWLVQDRPLPFNLAGLAMNMDFVEQ